jgi:hypothetical protein
VNIKAGTSLPLARKGQAVLDHVFAGLSLLTVGGSELFAPAIRRVIEKRIHALRDTILRDIEAGFVTEKLLEKEDELASFVIRMQRAAVEGCAKRKLRLMSSYFFKRALAPAYSEDLFLTFAGITEQLSDNELRCWP